MAWELYIDTIDVGQGESSLIIARNPQLGQHRTMLIDAGLPGYAKIVHEYVSGRLQYFGIEKLDHILVSHYDKDHSGGVIALLVADNFNRLCGIIAEAAGKAAYEAAINSQNAKHQIAAGTAAAAVAIMGGYKGKKDLRKLAIQAGEATWNVTFQSNITTTEIVKYAYQVGIKIIHGTTDKLNPDLFTNPAGQREAAAAAGIAAGQVANNIDARTAAALEAVFEDKNNAVSPNSRFQTNGIYSKIHIIDIGDTSGTPDKYINIINGSVLIGSRLVKVPGIERLRTPNPDLGLEIFWNTGSDPKPAPTDSPAVFVVACQGYIWKAPTNSIPISGGSQGNDDSIGLILRFNKFFFYTGGDLPSKGEDLIAESIMKNSLPNPSGGNFIKPDRIACFKCGHHGSEHSTSAYFLKTVKPRGALISCGDNQFGPGNHHPSQKAVNRLHYDKNIRYFYLTNCLYITQYVPASLGKNQLAIVGNKSRVAGDNAKANLKAGRERGNIYIEITEGLSKADNDYSRFYYVTYFEDDTPGPNSVRIMRIELTYF